MFGLAGLKLYGAIGAAVMVALFLAWVWRIDSLRAHYKQDLEACQTNHAQFVADVKAKTDEARRLDAAHKTEVEAKQAQISQENDNEIRRKIAAAVAAVGKRVQLTPATHPSGSGNPAMSSATVAPASAAGAGETAVVPAADLATCATNTVLAEGWQTWWKGVEAIPR
jgi:hypothetical protein